MNKRYIDWFPALLFPSLSLTHDSSSTLYLSSPRHASFSLPITSSSIIFAFLSPFTGFLSSFSSSLSDFLPHLSSLLFLSNITSTQPLPCTNYLHILSSFSRFLLPLVAGVTFLPHLQVLLFSSLYISLIYRSIPLSLPSLNLPN